MLSWVCGLGDIFIIMLHALHHAFSHSTSLLLHLGGVGIITHHLAGAAFLGFFPHVCVNWQAHTSDDIF